MSLAKEFDVMVSYEHKSGKKYSETLVETLRSEINGIRVWVDFEQMHGSLYGSMAKAVASSHILVALLSEGYEKSENCMGELMHTKKCNTGRMFVKVEDFHPSAKSPLSFLMKDDIYYKMYGDCDITQIVKEVRRLLEKCHQGVDSPDGAGTSTQETSNRMDSLQLQDDTSESTSSSTLAKSPQGATKPKDSPNLGIESKGLERSFADLKEEILEELAMRLNQLGFLAKWEIVAPTLPIDTGVIREIEANGTAHRLLFYKIRDLKPSMKLCEIKSILEVKMKKRARNDIFFDYERKDNLPTLDREIGSLDDNEFELVLKNVADRLIVYRTRGSWRDLGGHLDFNPTDLDSIRTESALDQSTSRARVFLDHLRSQDVKLRKFVDALKSDSIKRIDVYNFMMEQIDNDDCWA